MTPVARHGFALAQLPVKLLTKRAFLPAAGSA